MGLSDGEWQLVLNAWGKVEADVAGLQAGGPHQVKGRDPTAPSPPSSRSRMLACKVERFCPGVDQLAAVLINFVKPPIWFSFVFMCQGGWNQESRSISHLC